VAVIAGLGLLLAGVGALGGEVLMLLGIGIFVYNVTVLISLALRDSIRALAEVFDRWGTWEVHQ
jgi:hypothetical protein